MYFVQIIILFGSFKFRPWRYFLAGDSWQMTVHLLCFCYQTPPIVHNSFFLSVQNLIDRKTVYQKTLYLRTLGQKTVDRKMTYQKTFCQSHLIKRHVLKPQLVKRLLIKRQLVIIRFIKRLFR